MIDGGAERLEQEFMSYLLARPHTMPAELAQHFHLSERSAAYWLGCLVKSGRVRIASIEGRPGSQPLACQPSGKSSLSEKSMAGSR